MPAGVARWLRLRPAGGPPATAGRRGHRRCRARAAARCPPRAVGPAPSGRPGLERRCAGPVSRAAGRPAPGTGRTARDPGPAPPARHGTPARSRVPPGVQMAGRGRPARAAQSAARLGGGHRRVVDQLGRAQRARRPRSRSGQVQLGAGGVDGDQQLVEPAPARGRVGAVAPGASGNSACSGLRPRKSAPSAASCSARTATSSKSPMPALRSERRP